MKDFLSLIYEGFQLENDNWCDIAKSQFSHSYDADYKNKNYDKRVINQFYLLKYAPIYKYEYYEMYKLFLKNFKQDTANIFSIGVGVGLDYWGLSDVIIDLKSNLNIDYLGIDVIDWEYRFDIRFLQKSLEEITINDLKNFTLGEANIFVFPKSIIEIDDTILDKFANLILDLYKDKFNVEFWFLVSFIKSGDDISGVDKMKNFVNKFRDNGYNYEAIRLSNDNNFNIEKIDYTQYLDYWNTWKRDLYLHCRNCSHNPYCGLGDIYPMLKTKHLRYGIYKFKKGIE